MDATLHEFPGIAIALTRVDDDDPGPAAGARHVCDVLAALPWLEPLCAELVLACAERESLAGMSGRAPACPHHLLRARPMPARVVARESMSDPRVAEVARISEAALSAWMNAALVQDCAEGEVVTWTQLWLHATRVALPEHLSDRTELLLQARHGEPAMTIRCEPRGHVSGPLEAPPMLVPPIGLSFSNDGGDVAVVLAVHGSLWSEPGAPGTRMLETALAALGARGWRWEAHDWPRARTSAGKQAGDFAPSRARPASEDSPLIAVPAGAVELGLRPNEAERLAVELAEAERRDRAARQTLSCDRFDFDEAVAHRLGWLRASMPAFCVEVGSFRIQRHRVTRAAWHEFMRETDAATPAGPKGDVPSDHFVTGVSWREALAFARHRGMDLPTEPEWERAVRHERAFFPWGDRYPPHGAAAFASGLTTHAVGSRPALASVRGLEDVVGRFGEYCRDPFGPYPGADESWFDEHFPDWRLQRVVRGGYSVHQDSTTVSRGGVEEDRRGKYMTFRCVVRD